MAEAKFVHAKQIGGAGEFATVQLRLEPLPLGVGIEFSNEIIAGAIPSEFVPSIERNTIGSAAEYLIQTRSFQALWELASRDFTLLSQWC